MAPVKCGTCDKNVSRNTRYLHCALCEIYFHQTCTRATEDQHEALSGAANAGFLWLCIDCCPGFESRKVIKSISQQINDLAKQVPQVTSSQNRTAVKTFSAIVKEAIEKKDQNSENDSKPRNETLIIKPTDASKETLVNDLNSALKSVKVKSYRKRQDGSVVLNFPSKESKEAAEMKLKSDIQAVVAHPKKLKPKMTIVGIHKSIDDDDIVQAICDKNPEIDEMVKGGHDLELYFTRTHKQDKLAVVRLSPNIRALINNSRGFIYIGFSRCKAYDRFYVTQCYHCQKFNHIAENCSSKNSPPVCGRCSGQHATKGCDRNIKCSNCVSNNLSPTDHTSSSLDCPIMVRMRSRLMANTDYESKNE